LRRPDGYPHLHYDRVRAGREQVADQRKRLKGAADGEHQGPARGRRDDGFGRRYGTGSSSIAGCRTVACCRAVVSRRTAAGRRTVARCRNVAGRRTVADRVNPQHVRPRGEAPGEPAGRDVLFRLDLDHERVGQCGRDRAGPPQRTPGGDQPDAVSGAVGNAVGSSASGAVGRPALAGLGLAGVGLAGVGQPGPQPGHPVGRFLQPGAGQRAGRHRLRQRRADRVVHRLVGVPPQADQVNAGDDSEHRRRGNPVRPAGRLHLERVRDHHAAETEFAAEQAGDRGRGERRREVAGQLGHPQVPRHNGHGPGRDGRRERRQVPQAQFGQRAGDGGQRQVRVGGGAAVPGEMLSAGGHPGPLEARHGRRHMAGNQARVRPEGSGSDHRAAAWREHVGARREVGVDAEPREVAPDRGVHVAGERHVVGLAEGGVPGVGAARRVRHPGDVAALLVDGDDRLDRRGCAERRGQGGRVAEDVRAEQRDAGQPLLKRPADPGRRGGAGERRDEDGIG